MAPPSTMRISTLVALVVVQALVYLTFQATCAVPVGFGCPVGCNKTLSAFSATFLFEAGYKKISGACHGMAPQDCPLIAPNVFRCCNEFTFTIVQVPCFPVACEPEVHITHDKTISLQHYRGTLRTDLADWQSTTFVSCSGADSPVYREIDYTPPHMYRLYIIEACYNKCDAAGSMCGDPKLVGGDGVAFYFHGRKDRDFCLVSDVGLHVNAHFIGKRPLGRARDFTWVQALGFIFGPASHTLTVAVTRSVARWDDAVDHLEFVYNGRTLVLDNQTSWVSPDGAAVTLVMRTSDNPNAVDVEIKGKMGVSLTAVSIGKHESDVHHYGITDDDCFAHFDMQFRFYNLSAEVNGVLGQTYRPKFVNPAKRGVAMPVVGGADRFGTSSLLATDCTVSRYGATPPIYTMIMSATPNVAVRCGGSSLPNGVPGGITCRR